MTWNILFGGEDRFAAIEGVVAAARPDVLVLQECNGFDEGDRLARLAAAIGVVNDEAHVVLGLARPRASGRRFHVAVISRFTIHRRGIVNDEGVHHVIVEADVAAPGGDVLVVATHFAATGEDERLQDARTLRRQVSRRQLQEGRVLLAGDLNSLTRRDPYPADFDELLVRAGTEKYGHPARFEVMEQLDRHGFVDLLHVGGRPARWVTAERHRGGVRIDYRTDYLLASPALANSLLSVEVIDSGGASDHEPVVAVFR